MTYFHIVTLIQISILGTTLLTSDMRGQFVESVGNFQEVHKSELPECSVAKTKAERHTKFSTSIHYVRQVDYRNRPHFVAKSSIVGQIHAENPPTLVPKEENKVYGSKKKNGMNTLCCYFRTRKNFQKQKFRKIYKPPVFPFIFFFLPLTRFDRRKKSF